MKILSKFKDLPLSNLHDSDIQMDEDFPFRKKEFYRSTFDKELSITRTKTKEYRLSSLSASTVSERTKKKFGRIP